MHWGGARLCPIGAALRPRVFLWLRIPGMPGRMALSYAVLRCPTLSSAARAVECAPVARCWRGPLLQELARAAHARGLPTARAAMASVSAMAIVDAGASAGAGTSRARAGREHEQGASTSRARARAGVHARAAHAFEREQRTRSRTGSSTRSRTRSRTRQTNAGRPSGQRSTSGSVAKPLPG